MLWLEMSRDEVHGGGSWAFGRSLWSPSHKTNDARWAFWDTLLHVETGDPVLHLRGKGHRAAFVAFSTAAADGFETSHRPPSPGVWSYARSFYRVPLRNFTPLKIACRSATFSRGETPNSEVTSCEIEARRKRNGCFTLFKAADCSAF